MNTILVKNVEFKTGKFVFMLYISQILAGMATDGLVRFLTKIVNIPSSISLDIAAAIFCVIIASVHFAYWAEKKHPEILNAERIKIVSRRYIAISYIIFAFGFAGFNYLTEGSLDIANYVITMLIMSLVFSLIYIGTKYSIAKGCKMIRAKNKTLVAS